MNKLKRSEIKIIEFLSTNNTILIKNNEEFQKLKKFCESFGLDLFYRHFDDVIHETKYNGGYNGYVCFEYDNYRGLTYYTNKQKSANWYGVEPLTAEDIPEIS